jgi:hypothetical protein
VRRELGGTIHDVLLATVAGAVARYLDANYINPATLDFRVAVPVTLRGEDGSRVGRWSFELPIWERDPLRRLERVRELTAEQHAAQPAVDARGFLEGPWTSFALLNRGAQALTQGAAARMRVVNVPGPQQPLYLEGARLIECFGMVPLGPQAGIGVAVMSYDGRICVGLNADYDRVPDLARFADALEASFRELRLAASRARRRFAVVG